MIQLSLAITHVHLHCLAVLWSTGNYCGNFWCKPRRISCGYSIFYRFFTVLYKLCENVEIVKDNLGKVYNACKEG